MLTYMNNFHIFPGTHLISLPKVFFSDTVPGLIYSRFPHSSKWQSGVPAITPSTSWHIMAAADTEGPGVRVHRGNASRKPGDSGPAPAQCRASVTDAGPALSQRWGHRVGIPAGALVSTASLRRGDTQIITPAPLAHPNTMTFTYFMPRSPQSVSTSSATSVWFGPFC